eukprot:1160670-Pelagomonas_calceolata.AAC.1
MELCVLGACAISCLTQSAACLAWRECCLPGMMSLQEQQAATNALEQELAQQLQQSMPPDSTKREMVKHALKVRIVALGLHMLKALCVLVFKTHCSTQIARKHAPRQHQGEVVKART